MTPIQKHMNFRASAAALFLCLGLCTAVFLPGPAWGFRTAEPSSKGTVFSGFRDAVDHYDEQGFLLLGKFEHAGWPAKVISEKEADDEISFSMRTGPSHTYPGYFGYRLKVVIFEDSNQKETVLVFRSKKKAGEPERTVVAAQPVKTEPMALRVGIARIARQLSDQDGKGPKRRITVLDFSDVQGQINSAGAVIAEVLINELFRTGRYEIVDRKHLSAVLEQHRLNMTGLVDESTARKVGKLLGVDFIVTGTVIDFGTSLNVNARTIAIETGAISATASADLVRDAFQNLPQRPVVVEPVRGGQASAHFVDLEIQPGSFTPWLDEKAFAAQMDRQWKDGYYPAVVEGRAGPVVNEYRAVVQPFPKKVFWFYWWFGQLGSQYEEHRQRMTADGYREISRHIFTDREGMRRYQTCWLKEGS
ncbi:MAG: FlgO family outer membrane protein [Nitrospirota bacterium]